MTKLIWPDSARVRRLASKQQDGTGIVVLGRFFPLRFSGYPATVVGRHSLGGWRNCTRTGVILSEAEVDAS
jgi:hypothetical protein